MRTASTLSAMVNVKAIDPALLSLRQARPRYGLSCVLLLDVAVARKQQSNSVRITNSIMRGIIMTEE